VTPRDRAELELAYVEVLMDVLGRLPDSSEGWVRKDDLWFALRDRRETARAAVAACSLTGRT
jgi:hypothetical protein